MLRVIQSAFTWLPLTQNWLAVQIAHLPERIHSSTVATRTIPGREWPGVRVPRLHGWEPGRVSRRLCRPLRRRLLSRMIGDGRRVVVHSHFADQAWEDLAPVGRAGCGHLATFYGYDVGWLPSSGPRWSARYRQLFAGADRILCEGPFMARAVADLGCPAHKLQVHHLGVDLRLLPFEPRRWQSAEPLRVLMAASFLEKKGFPYGLRALGRLARSTKLQVTLIGDAADNEASRAEKRAILQAISEAGLTDTVRMLGYQPHEALHREARAHHLFLQPSVTAANGDSEGGAPVSLIEMTASGMAVVSTRHCDIPEVIVDGTTGWLAPERDVDSLVAALRQWTDHADSWEKLLAAGRRHIEAEFDAERQGERLAGIYERVAAEKGR